DRGPPMIQLPPTTPPERDQRLARALDEYLAALQTGAPGDREALLARHPDLADDLRDCLASLEYLRQGNDPTAAGGPGTLGDFRLLREVGRGGMGVVYEAEQVSLGRRVAVKVLPLASTLDARQLQRFKNEAQAAAQLHHTNIVPVYFVGCERGVHFYAMQFIDGQSLADIIGQLRRLRGLPKAGHVSGLANGLASGCWAPKKGQPAAGEPAAVLPGAAADQETPTQGTARTSVSGSQQAAYFRTVAHLGVQAAEALEHAHGLGVIHRDVKPANLMVDQRGNLWVTDFGLAHCQGDAGLTLTGDLIGTLRYMSPEQALARRVPVDQRT